MSGVNTTVCSFSPDQLIHSYLSNILSSILISIFLKYFWVICSLSTTRNYLCILVNKLIMISDNNVKGSLKTNYLPSCFSFHVYTPLKTSHQLSTRNKSSWKSPSHWSEMWDLRRCLSLPPLFSGSTLFSLTFLPYLADYTLSDKNIYFALPPTPHLFIAFSLISPLVNGSCRPTVGGD